MAAKKKARVGAKAKSPSKLIKKRLAAVPVRKLPEMRYALKIYNAAESTGAAPDDACVTACALLLGQTMPTLTPKRAANVLFKAQLAGGKVIATKNGDRDAATLAALEYVARYVSQKAVENLIKQTKR